MCGIAGYYGIKDENLLTQMCDTITHRGPDDSGMFSEGEVGLGVRRLSIIDIEGGHQPFQNEDGSICSVFNGEIYNFKEIKERLQRKGHTFHSHCDSEIFVHAYEEFGHAFVQELNGMFGVALFDRNKNELILARDRLGIKPLYYFYKNEKILFASELKALLKNDFVPREPNLEVLDEYLELRYVSAPNTMIKGVKKLPAGHMLILKNGSIEVRQFWKPKVSNGMAYTEEEALSRFENLLIDSIQKRLMTDVPLGAFLSGGLDSSLIVAIMSKLTGKKVRTFSLGFNSRYDELSEAKSVAQSIGCDHHEVICGPEDLRDLSKVVWHMDEPNGDALILASYVLSKKAAENVKVVLSGEGADEIMAGYPFHKIMKMDYFYTKFCPDWVNRRAISPLFDILPVSMLDKLFPFPAFLGSKGKIKLGYYLKNIKNMNESSKYFFLRSLFDKEDRKSLYGDRYKEFLKNGSPLEKGQEKRSFDHFMNEVLLLQYNGWLQDNILHRQDRTTMACSLELRVPFLDHRLVDFSFTLPTHLKIKTLCEKFLLKKIAEKMLPQNIVYRKKQPFYIPVENWTEHRNFKELTGEFLSEDAVKKRGLFDYSHIKDLKKKIGGHEFLYVKQVVSLIILEIWFRSFIDNGNS